MITSIWTVPGEKNETAATLRAAVFCGELGLPPEVEQDEFDPFSFQLALLSDGVPVAAGRFYLRAVGKAQLSRICVLPEWRRQGIGDGLIRILDFKAAMAGLRESYAQVPLAYVPLFQRIGFVACGEPEQELGQTVQPMRKETNDGTKGHCAHQ